MGRMSNDCVDKTRIYKIGIALTFFNIMILLIQSSFFLFRVS